MGSSGAAGGGSGQQNDAIDDSKLKRGGLMLRGCNNWACIVMDGVARISRLAWDDGEGEGRQWEVKGNHVD
jgi:hypothetical protein